MIYWWLFNVWIGVMGLAEYAKDDGVFAGYHWGWFVFIGIQTLICFVLLIFEWKKLSKPKKS